MFFLHFLIKSSKKNICVCTSYYIRLCWLHVHNWQDKNTFGGIFRHILELYVCLFACLGLGALATPVEHELEQLPTWEWVSVVYCRPQRAPWPTPSPSPPYFSTSSTSSKNWPETGRGQISHLQPAACYKHAIEWKYVLWSSLLCFWHIVVLAGDGVVFNLICLTLPVQGLH